MPDMLKFDLPKNQSNIIKVIGVGGGGSNAVTHMYRQGITGVDFIICNTDAQAMESSPVPTRIQLGTHLTQGLGAGAVPSVGRNAALENTEDIRAILSKGTKMVFITAGLGGGTGTGAAPVIAQISKEMDILTVAIVTIPFQFEGRKRILHADDGIRQLKEQVDALLIISNDKLRELYGNLRLSEAFERADNVLTTAAKGIAEIITVAGYINVDFEDVKTVMKNSGVAIMGTGVASGENRACKAVEEALSSPLLNNNDIEGACNLLLYIASGKEEITMDEVTDITDYIQAKTKNTAEVIWGNGFDESLEDKISVTIIATGFDEEHRAIKEKTPHKIVKTLYDEEKPAVTVTPLFTPVEEPQSKPVEDLFPTIQLINTPPKPEIRPVPEPEPELVNEPETIMAEEPAMTVEPEPAPEPQREIVFELDLDPPEAEKPLTVLPRFEAPEPKLVTGTLPGPVQPVPVPAPVMKTTPAAAPTEIQERRQTERISKLRALSEKLKSHAPIEQTLSELEAVPAYKRRNVELADVPPSSESSVPRLTLSGNTDSGIEMRTENSFLHNNVD
jgi:cell division protein FtsZ